MMKKIREKAYGKLFTDIVMRRMHIEFVLRYDTLAFLIVLRIFISIHGFLSVI